MPCPSRCWQPGPGWPWPQCGTRGISRDRVNVNGGGIAVGHPAGMSGARLVRTLALELRCRGGGTGVAALCGGGHGGALLLRVPAA